MEKALLISQELQSLKIKQDELEEKLQTVETELNLVSVSCIYLTKVFYFVS